MIIRITDENQLCCPKCNSEYGLHIDQVLVSARLEDSVFNEIAVNAVTGRVETHRVSRAPQGTTVGRGRRHRIALIGYCESCGKKAPFSVVFTQHKGTTFVELSDDSAEMSWAELMSRSS